MNSLCDYPDLSDKVYDILKEEILSGRLTPGSKMGVVGLSQRLDVSRTPIAVALNRLLAEGLVENKPRKGYVVSRPDPQDILERLDIRLMLELAAVERGINLAEPQEITKMWQMVDEMEQLIKEGEGYRNYPVFSQQDAEFHLAIVGTAKNRRLSYIYRNLNVHVHLMRMQIIAEFFNYQASKSLRVDVKETTEDHWWQPRPLEQVVAEHKTIVKSFDSRNLHALEQALKYHLQNVKERMIERLKKLQSVDISWMISHLQDIGVRNSPAHNDKGNYENQKLEKTNILLKGRC